MSYLHYAFRNVAAALLVIIACSSPAISATMQVETVEHNGIYAWMIPDDNLPLIAVNITINHSGSAYDGDHSGLASFATAMLTEGAGKYDAQAFQEALDFHAISLSASAGRDHTTISMQTLSEHADTAFALLGAILREPRFETQDVARIRTTRIAALQRLMERPGFKLERAFSDVAFANHPYHSDVSGTPESLKNITRNMLQGWVNAHIAKDKLTISIAGDLSASYAQTLIAKHLNALPESVQVQPLASTTLPKDGARKHVSINSPQSRVSVALPGVSRQDKDFYTMYVLNHILGGSGLSARLGEALRQERGLTYGVYSGLSILDHAHWLEINFSTQNARLNEAITATQDVLRTIADNGVTQEERDAAISYLTGAFPLNIDSNRERASYLDVMQREQLGRDYFSTRNSFIEAVTRDALNEAAKTYLPPKHLVIISAGGGTP